MKALRTADFKLYCEVLLQLMPWVFTIDNSHYARDLPAHLRDMLALEELHPVIHKEFNFSKVYPHRVHYKIILVPRFCTDRCLVRESQD